MDTFTAWRIDDMISEIDDMASKAGEHESDYDPADFEIIIDSLCKARKALKEVLWVIQRGEQT